MARAGAGKLQFLGVVDTSDASHNGRYGSHNSSYVNPFVRGVLESGRLRISSTVGGPRPVTIIVVKPAPVASDFDWIPSPYSDGFRFGV